MPRPRPTPDSPSSEAHPGIGFLLSQVASHSTARFTEGLEPLGIKPAHVGVLAAVQRADGSSQQALGERLGMFASRLVGIIDDLEGRGLVERRDSPTDRRSYALYLTDAGRAALDQIARVSTEREKDIFAALSDEEKAQMAGFLRRIAAQQGLRPGVHPALQTLTGDEAKGPPKSKSSKL